MIGFGSLLAVLFVLYLVEYAAWIPSDAVAFRVCSGGKFPLRMVVRPRAVTRARVAFSYPLPLRSAILVSSWASASISPAGIVTGTPGRFLPFENISSIETAARSVLANGETFVSGSSGAQANQWAGLLRKLCKCEPQDRASQIEKFLSNSLDADRARARVQHYLDESFRTCMDSAALFVVTFVVSPILVWRWGLRETWPILVFSFFVSLLVILGDFRRAERELFPEPETNRWESIVTILISPPAALRATKYLARDAAAAYHPLAIAAAGCSDAEFGALASWTLRQLMFVPDVSRTLGDGAVDCAEWFRHELLEQVSKLVRSEGRSPELLVSAPSLRDSQHAQSYCPRCLAQYVISRGVCTDCGGVSLRPLDESGRNVSG